MRKAWAALLVLTLILSVVGVSAAAPPSTKVAGTFLLALKSESISDSALAAIAEAGGTVTRRIDSIGTVEVTTDDSTAFLKAMVKRKEISGLSPAIPVALNLPDIDESAMGSSPSDPTDPAAYTWGVERVTNNGAAWDIHSGTHDVVVAVLDTGIDLEHPDLIANIVPGSRSYVPGEPDAYDYHSHGTHVAGTIAANGVIKGVAPGVGIRAYKVLGASGSGSQAGILQAIVDAANDGVDVINMSLGGFYTNGRYWYTDPDTGERFSIGSDTADFVAYKRAIQYAVSKGVTVVAAAGNEELNLARRNDVTQYWNDYLHAVGYTMFEVQGATFVAPATLPGVVTVSAMGGGWDTPDRLAFYSNYQQIDVTAPGGDLGPDLNNLEYDYEKYLILSTTPRYYPCAFPMAMFGTCNYGWKAGTSMASPHAAGVAALIISEHYARTGTKPSPSQVVAIMQQTADDIGKPGTDWEYGKGLVNAYRAMGGQ